MDQFALAAFTQLIERFFGYPDRLLKRLGHPVQWMGALISHLDATLNADPELSLQAKLRGIAALALIASAAGIPSLIIAKALYHLPGGFIVEVLLATTLIAQKSLRDHVRDVARALSASLAAGRASVAKIVGRETATLDESGVVKAALESLAENTADGVVAPIFWYALLGLPGIAIYKAINTADSMIGHKSERYLNFGWAAARADDLINLPASRLTALLFIAAAALTSKAAGVSSARAAWRDASAHRSPNAGWPEAAMAGAFGVRFGGPRAYDGEIVDLPWMGDGRTQLTRADIDAGLQLYDRTLWLLTGLLALLAVVL